MIKRGEIWWASMEIQRGSEPGYRRPVVIVSSNAFNKSKINTVLAVVITSNIKLSLAPGNLTLPKKGTGLSKESVVNVSQIITLDKSFITEKIGRLNPSQLGELDEGLRLILSI